MLRRHRYRIEFSLVCSLFSGGGAGWTHLAVKIGLDEKEVLSRLEEIDELREALERPREEFEGHTHTCRTGVGVGHDKTPAETRPPDAGDPEPTPSEPVRGPRSRSRR